MLCKLRQRVNSIEKCLRDIVVLGNQELFEGGLCPSRGRCRKSGEKRCIFIAGHYPWELGIEQSGLFQVIHCSFIGTVVLETFTQIFPDASNFVFLILWIVSKVLSPLRSV